MTRRLFPRLPSRTIGGQIVALVLVSVGLFSLALSTTSSLFGERQQNPEQSAPALADRFAEFARLLDQLPADLRPQIVSALRVTYPALELTLLPAPASPPPSEAFEPPPGTAGLFAQLGRVLGPDLRPFTPTPRAAANEPKRRPREVAVSLRDGAVVTGLVLPIGSMPRGPSAGAIVAATFGFLVLMLTLLLWWATRSLTAPLARFARAAESFSLDRSPAAPLPETRGPREVRVASQALNRMQARIRGMVEDRTRMLAAVGHDLRTPITRMRLRAEFVEDEEIRRQLLRDLDQMGAMVHSALSYLRDGREHQTRSLVDLASLLQTVCDDFADAGEAVAYQGPDHVLVHVAADDIKRAVTNLVENALKYSGTAVAVRLRPAAGRDVDIEVVDEGPGIPDERKAEMLEPFARGDAARTMNGASAGFGLGLAIARAAAEAHGGELVLRNTMPSGLIAALRLPVRAEPGQAPASRPAAAPAASAALGVEPVPAPASLTPQG